MLSDAYRRRRVRVVACFVEGAKEAESPLLEIRRGTGRVLIPTARAGIDIVGLDVSPSILAECRPRLRDEPNAVRARVGLVHSDLNAA